MLIEDNGNLAVYDKCGKRHWESRTTDQCPGIYFYVKPFYFKSFSCKKYFHSHFCYHSLGQWFCYNKFCNQFFQQYLQQLHIVFLNFLLYLIHADYPLWPQQKQNGRRECIICFTFSSFIQQPIKTRWLDSFCRIFAPTHSIR